MGSCLNTTEMYMFLDKYVPGNLLTSRLCQSAIDEQQYVINSLDEEIERLCSEKQQCEEDNERSIGELWETYNSLTTDEKIVFMKSRRMITAERKYDNNVKTADDLDEEISIREYERIEASEIQRGYQRTKRDVEKGRMTAKTTLYKDLSKRGRTTVDKDEMKAKMRFQASQERESAARKIMTDGGSTAKKTGGLMEKFEELIELQNSTQGKAPAAASTSGSTKVYTTPNNLPPEPDSVPATAALLDYGDTYF